MVAWFGAVQAQEFGVAKWAIAQRTHTLTDADLDRAFDAGDILRTHVLRPTWHFVARDDLRWLMTLSGPRVQQANSSMYRKMGITAAEFRRVHAVCEKALAHGPRTRNELRVDLARARIEAKDSIRCACLLMHAELDRVICSGPRRGNQFTYALFDERVPAAKAVSRDEALGRLTQRYFQSRRPATVHDFGWWSGLTIADARRGIEVSGVDVDLAPPLASTRGVLAHLLPIYDEYPLAYKDRSAALPDKAAARTTTPRGGLTFMNIVVIDGVIAGRWTRDVSSTPAVVTIHPTRAWSASERRAVLTEAERYGRFLGAPIRVICRDASGPKRPRRD